MSSYKLPSRRSLRGIWRPLPCATARERRLRLTIRVGAIGLLCCAGVMVLLLKVLPGVYARWTVAVVPLFWVSGVSIAVCAVKLSEAHMDGKKLAAAARWKICPNCEYDLSAQDDSGTCPECGDSYTVEELSKIWSAVYERLEEKPG